MTRLFNVFVFQAQTNSAKRRRRLCYHPEEEEIQACVLLDHPASKTQPRSQGFSLFVIGKSGKGPGTGRSHDFQHPDIVGVINYNNNE